MSKAKRAHIEFSVSKMAKRLRNYSHARRLSSCAPVFLTAVLEYLTAEIIELAGNIAHDRRKRRISPQMINMAIRGDKELDKLLSDVTIAKGGVWPI